MNWMRGVLLSTCFAALLAQAGCGSEAGSFTLSITWETPPEGEVWLWVRVEERTDPTAAGAILASAGPEAYTYGSPFSLSLENVTNGDNRYVIAEVREGPNPGLPIVYYGISEPFILASGSNVEVEVPMTMQAPETQAVEASVQLQFSGEIRDQVNIDELKHATIVARSVNAHAVFLANDASFSAAAVQIALDETETISCTEIIEDGVSWDLCEITNWDLTAGLKEETTDEQFTLFVKFLDRYGYESPVYRTSVMLDSQGPLVLMGSLSPSVSRPGQQLYLNVTFHEALAQESDAGELTVQPPFPADTIVEGPVRVGTSTTYLWTAALASSWGEDESFTFNVTTRDFLGNVSADQSVVDQDGIPLMLSIDPVPPLLTVELTTTPSPALFGLSDVGGVLGFQFVIEEEHPHGMTAGADGCEGLCPEVRLGTALLGTVHRMPELDAADDNRLAFRYEYVVDANDFTKTDSEVSAMISWSDQAGNLLEAEVDGPIHFDFQPPGVLSCSLLPDSGNASSTFIYTLTSTEVLAEDPELQVESTGVALFSSLPVMSDDGQTYSWHQPADGLESQTIGVAAKLLDKAGNVSGDGVTDAFLCPLATTVDGEAPLIIAQGEQGPEMWTEPAVTGGEGEAVLACGDKDTLWVAFTVAEANSLKEGHPQVRLAVPGQEMFLTQTAAEEIEGGKTRFTYSLVLSATVDAAAEGLWPVRVTVQDEAGNQTIVDALGDNALVKIDFTAPTAECSLIPTPPEDGYAIGQKVLLQISPFEELATDSQPLLEEGFEPSFEGPFLTYDAGTLYRFSHVISEGNGEHLFSVAISLTDLVGNTTAVDTTACLSGLVSGAFDSTAPSVEVTKVEVVDSALEPSSDPLRAGLTVAATVMVSNSAVLPQATLGLAAMTTAQTEPLPIEDDQFQWVLKRALDGSEGEGWQDLSVTVTDAAGNSSFHVEDEVALLDFTPPTSQCTASPASAALGDLLMVTISAAEPLQGDLPDFQSTPAMSVPEPIGGATSFTYTHEVIDDDADLTGWNYAVKLTDLAGNVTENACSGGGSLDGAPPELVEQFLSVAPVVNDVDGAELLMVGDGDQILAEFTVSEDHGLAIDEVYLDFPGSKIPLDEIAVSEPQGGTHSCVYGLTIDELLHHDLEGTWPVALTIHDDAGNVVKEGSLADASVTVDLTPPQAECSFIPAPGDGGYGIGQKVILLVAPFEALEAGSLPQVSDVLQGGPDGPFFSYDEGTFYRFSGTIGTWDVEGSLAATVSVTDLVGNSNPIGEDACIVPVTAGFDALSPSIVGGAKGVEFSAERIAEHSLMELFFAVVDDEELPDPLVTVGGRDMDKSAFPPGDSYTHRYGYTPDTQKEAPDDEGVWPVSITLEDWAGNQTSYSPGTVHFDFSGPALSGTPGVQLIKPETCPLQGISALGRGGSVVVTFAVNEVLLHAPEVSFQIAGAVEPIPLSPVGDAQPDQFAYTYQLEAAQTLLFAEGLEEGGTIQLGAIDLAGNEATLVLADSLPVDTTAPSVPDVGSDSAIVFTRIPWGNDATDGAKTYLLRGESGAVEPGNAVLVYDGEFTSTALLLGQAQAGVEGDFGAQPGMDGAFKLVPTGMPTVYIEALDDACNRSASEGSAAQVRNGEWVATMGYKVPGSSAANPHTFTERPWFTSSLWGPTEEEAAQVGSLGTVAGGSVETAGAGSWMEVDTDWREPPPRHRAPMTYDSWRGRVVLYGGYGLEGDMGDTWEFDGVTWHEITPSDPEEDGNPGKTSVGWFASMAFDEKRGKAVLYDGLTRETWEWDGLSWSLRLTSDPEADGDPDMAGVSRMTYDAKRQLIVMAMDNVQDRLELWEYDGASWRLAEELTDGEGAPEGRTGMALAYDPALEKVLFFGGKRGPWNDKIFFADTWVWDGELWTELTPDGPPEPQPEEVDGAVMAYDWAQGRMLLFGGGRTLVGPAYTSGVLWAWKGNSWTLLAENPSDADGALPPASTWAGFVSDKRRTMVVLFGGKNEKSQATSQPGTFDWDGSAWHKRNIEVDVATPPPLGELAWFPSQKVGFFQGYDEAGALNGTYESWEFDSSGWRQREPDNMPLFRTEPALAHDASEGRILLFGGNRSNVAPYNDLGDRNDLWAWDGEDWTLVHEGSDSDPALPSPRFGAGLAYDDFRDIIVLFGGGIREGSQVAGVKDDTWEFDGADWNPVVLLDPEGDGNPVGRYYHELVFAPDAESLLVLNGITAPEKGRAWHDHWEYDGDSWLKRHSQANPPSTTLPIQHDWGNFYRNWEAFLNPATGDLTAIGHNSGTAKSLQAWRWDGEEWSTLAICDAEGDGAPSPRYDFALDRLEAPGEALLVGGRTGTLTLSEDTWLWRQGLGDRPGQVYRCALDEAAVDDEWYTGIAVTWYAGGHGAAAEDSVPGARLLVWDQGAWEEKDTNSLAAPGEAPLLWATQDVEALQSLAVSARRILGVAVTPFGTNGKEYATLNSSYAEVVLNYRLPEGDD
jgi:hypothetical protein